MNSKILFFLIVSYILTLIFISYKHNMLSTCEDECKLQYIGNILTCDDMDLECYEYYNNIYNQCLQKCQ